MGIIRICSQKTFSWCKFTNVAVTVMKYLSSVPQGQNIYQVKKPRSGDPCTLSNSGNFYRLFSIPVTLWVFESNCQLGLSNVPGRLLGTEGHTEEWISTPALKEFRIHKEWSSDTCCDMNGLWKHQWKQPVTKRHSLHDSMYVTCPQKANR